MIYKRSSTLFNEAQNYIPGGVNSPVRAFKGIGGTPVFFKKAKGAYLFDEDDRKYIDYINSWGPMILGHSVDFINDALKEQIEKGTSFGAPTVLETQIAKLIVEMVPNIDKVRMVNSGTEACMSAIRLARGFTKREKIIKFEGCYHGHSDAFLIKAGSGAATFGSPNSPGVTQGTAKDTLLARYNDLAQVETLIDQNEGTIAAIILEPVAGNMGTIRPSNTFLKGLRSLCNEKGILLIFDEVMTGFRLAKGGAQEALDIDADIVTFGKVIGGGLPVGAFAARDEIMSCLAPLGNVYQAGTLSGNPIAMTAGLMQLKQLNMNPQIFEKINDSTAYLHKGFDEVLQKNQIDYTINRFGSMITIFFSPEEVKDFDTAQKANNDYFKKFFHGMLENGIYLPPSSFETWFISHALSQEDLDRTIEVVDKVTKAF
ncbi:MAG: glutamate-1-semialdehyde 2,1-aminomutase [Flavobacteriales bacterium]